jgi:hypothetical protein
MAQKLRCIYRKKKCFNLCNRTTIKNTYYCCHHIHSKKKHLCKIFFDIFEENAEIRFEDIYKIYKYILENTQENDDIFINILFIDLLKMIPMVKLSSIYKNYIDNDNITEHNNPNNLKTFKRVLEDNKNNLYMKIYSLNYHTYLFSNKCNINILTEFQNIVKYKLLCNSNDGKGVISNYLNDEDVFTYANINDIHPRKLFTIKDIRGTYAFDIVELEYFIRKCINENVVPYNPYTREALNEKTIWRLNMKMLYNNITKKPDECKWSTDMHAYTDLSIEIERRGFYNNPEWFKKMSKNDFIKCIKLFRDFSCNVDESRKYFLNIEYDNDSFTYDFCKESIKMFKECNDDLYILCCNYMKSLALCSNDFYNNVPDWLSTYETTSYLSSISNISNFTSFISTLISNDINNINNINDDDGDNQSNNQDNSVPNNNNQANILNTNYDMNMNMNMNIEMESMPSLVSPSNNFLLYYYVEYM